MDEAEWMEHGGGGGDPDDGTPPAPNMPLLKCLDRHNEECAGEVDYREPLSPTGRSFPRCDKHWEARLEKQAEIRQNYPDSPNPPAWFDESYAGETWDDE